jgi:hypothetical protein
VPIAAALVPWLRDALQQSPSELVFPHVCGTSCPRKSCPGPGGMLSREVALEAVLRRALGRAGIVRGWKHVCRRRGCRHKEPASDASLRVQHAALAQAGRPPHSVPRPPSHDGNSASPREGAPGRRAEGAPTPRPEADRAGLRTPRR